MNEQDIPRDLHYTAIQSRLDYMKAIDAKNEELFNSMKEIQERYRKELYEFLSPKSEDYKTFYEKRKEAANSMKSKFTATPEGAKAEIEFHVRRLVEADEFIKSLGIVANDLRSIRGKYTEKFGQGEGL